ncbi:biotin--[acetyl-CoA-carboxylase] ligase [Aldersonia sp. NBC_00410]|uniref:biotin--[acetyl-CoA-carboxylase] ligase n=1 Tax=Aldersonia sp. NBC_00410 TaxID=2975954 RepID=UPI00225B9C51|nr:biotin--[acetyl-CoA-carboxylase] ligase [Aldersonia sp. NBC_00410]MCX5044514.1 biotin--[acetyl-CoA-carboxylase] ligase [Aldersonia sp. NBC_00410]
MYTDLNRPPLNAAELRRGMDFYSSIDVVDKTGSTNADLLARAGEPDADRAVLIAEFQEHGRGRHSRTWVSPPQAQIAASVLFRMPADVDSASLGWLPLLTGIAVTDALRTVAKVDADLKWPNDVLIDGRKVAGILAEVAWPQTDGVKSPAVVVGVGLNVSLQEDELPVPEATSLALAGAEVTDRTTLARALLRALAQRWTNWADNDFSAGVLAGDYRGRCVTLGAQVRADLPGGSSVVGTASDIDDNGRLLIATDGETVAVTAGDVTHLRTAQ